MARKQWKQAFTKMRHPYHHSKLTSVVYNVAQVDQQEHFQITPYLF